VLDLSEDQSVPHANDAEVIWAPDSKRFAFNYSPPHRSHSSYETIALYQLRDDKWVALPSPLDETSERSQVAQLTRLPKNRDPRHAELLRDVLKVRHWTDANTAILYAHAIWVGGSRDSKSAFLFTLKFDANGKSKIVKTEKVPNKDIED
jgi:hypothetical protein